MAFLLGIMSRSDPRVMIKVYSILLASFIFLFMDQIARKEKT